MTTLNQYMQDVQRLLREAKRRNPGLLTYGLSWATPRWVGDGSGNGTGFFSGDNILYHVRWLECVRNVTNITVDILGDWNEKPMGPASYIVDLRAALDDLLAGRTTELSLTHRVRAADVGAATGE